MIVCLVLSLLKKGRSGYIDCCIVLGCCKWSVRFITFVPLLHESDDYWTTTKRKQGIISTSDNPLSLIPVWKNSTSFESAIVKMNSIGAQWLDCIFVLELSEVLSWHKHNFGMERSNEVITYWQLPVPLIMLWSNILKDQKNVSRFWIIYLSRTD